jgi:gas vesicle protein
MKNPLNNNTNKVLIPVLVGAAAAAGIAYFLISDDTAELREELVESLTKVWDNFKDKAMEKVAGLQSKAEVVADDSPEIMS